MPEYSEISQERLSSCHPDLQKIFQQVIKFVDCSIFCGHRGETAQNQAYAENLSTLQYPFSKHNSNPSMAVDAGPYFPELKNTDWDDKVAYGVFAGHVKQVAMQLLEAGDITHAIRWGGDWDGNGRSSDETFIDLPHFELVKL